MQGSDEGYQWSERKERKLSYIRVAWPLKRCFLEEKRRNRWVKENQKKQRKRVLEISIEIGKRYQPNPPGSLTWNHKAWR